MRYFYLLKPSRVSVGANYANQTFYDIEEGTTTSVDHTVWDIAFSCTTGEAGVFVNEAVAASFSTPLPEVELYLTNSTDFATADTTDMVRIYNLEINKSEGAFNHVKEVSNPLDMGWGDYDSGTQHVNGTRVFAVKLRNGIYKKLKIQSLIDGIFTFNYANLDGSDEQSATIDKADYDGKTLAYFSIENERNAGFRAGKLGPGVYPLYSSFR